jgi:hypothetical protein
MSLLLFQLDAESVIVATDTLATRVDGRPYLLVSKCTVVPHLGSVIAFTGNAAIGQRWAAAVHSNLLCLDFDMLDQHTSDNLRRIAADIDEEYGPVEGPSTIYHFGYSASDEQYAGYAYRSESDFESERLNNGFGMKPPPNVRPTESPSTIEEMIALADQIRDEQNALPPSERLWVGGDLVFAVLAEGYISVNTMHRFADFDAQWLAMNRFLKEDNANASEH